MNINQLLNRAASHYYGSYYYTAVIDNSMPHDLFFYKVKETETTVEIPFGYYPDFGEMGIVGIPVIQDGSNRGWARNLPKTGLSIFNNVLGGRLGNLTPFNNHLGNPYIKSAYGFILRDNNTPIIEFTKVINKVTHNGIKYICKINSTLLNEEDVISKFIKATLIKNLIANGIDSLPCDVIITKDFESPLRRVEPPMTEVEQHEAEVHAIMESHTEEIVNLSIPSRR